MIAITRIIGMTISPIRSVALKGFFAGTSVSVSFGSFTTKR